MNGGTLVWSARLALQPRRRQVQRSLNGNRAESCISGLSPPFRTLLIFRSAQLVPGRRIEKGPVRTDKPLGIHAKPDSPSSVSTLTLTTVNWLMRALRVVCVTTLALNLLAFAAVQFQQRLLRNRAEQLTALFSADAFNLLKSGGEWCTEAEGKS